MANTAADLAKDVGLELGIIEAGAELSADELEDLKKVSTQFHAMIRISPRICWWDEDDIPDEVYLPLKLCLAAWAGKQFGKKVVDEGLDESQTRRMRLRALSAIAAPRYAGQRTRSVYY